MPMHFDTNRVVLSGVVGVEDAEPLLAQALTWESPHVDLSGCTHLHPANLQVLLASRCTIAEWPEDPTLAAWLSSVLPGPLPHHASFAQLPTP